jgi:hypothetical protein
LQEEISLDEEKEEGEMYEEGRPFGGDMVDRFEEGAEAPGPDPGPGEGNTLRE